MSIPIYTLVVDSAAIDARIWKILVTT